MKDLEQLKKLTLLDLSKNKLINFDKVKCITDLSKLKVLSLKDNPLSTS